MRERFRSDAGFTLPPELRMVAEVALSRRFEEEVRRQQRNPDPEAYRNGGGKTPSKWGGFIPAVPFDALGVPIGGSVQFFVELLQSGQGRDRAPREGVIALTRPSANFEHIMWDV